MKHFIHIILFLLIVFPLSGAEPLQKAYIELKINGQLMKDGDDLFVQKGDELSVTAQLKGGRRDYVQFPGTYANLDSKAQIITRNLNNLVYTQEGKTHEWRMTDENIKFESDNNVLVKMIPSERQYIHRAIINISTRKLKVAYLKVKVTTDWALLINDQEKSKETNEAVCTINLIIKENADAWYSSANIRATGKPDSLVAEKLDNIQELYKIIEQKLVARDFSGAQAEMRNLESKIQETSALISKIKENQPNYYAGVTFIGLPSDNPVKDGETFAKIQESWTKLYSLLQEEETKFLELDSKPENDQKRELYEIIETFDHWWHELPSEYVRVLQKYIPEETWEENLHVNYFLSFNPEKEKVSDTEQTKVELQNFIEARKIKYKAENQKISATLLRLRASRLLDGMLMSYFTAIDFANWESNRE